MNSVEKPMQLKKEKAFFFFLNPDAFTSPASTATRGWKHDNNCLLVHYVWKAIGQAAEERIDILSQFFCEENYFHIKAERN